MKKTSSPAYPTQSIKVIALLCLASIARIALAIQVHENIENDVTTSTTTLRTSTLDNTAFADEDDHIDASTTAVAVSETTTETVVTPKTIGSPPISTTKLPRAETGFKHNGDQQLRSTTRVNTKQFVPSPQLSPIAFPSVAAENARENVLPLNNVHLHYPTFGGLPSTSATPSATTTTVSSLSSGGYLPRYYKPTSENLVLGEPAAQDTWRISSSPAQSPLSYQYPITSAGVSGGKWYWMPNSMAAPEALPTAPSVVTSAASPFATDVPYSQQNWRWMFDQKYGTGSTAGGTGGIEVGPSGPEAGYPQPSYRPATPDFTRVEHPYSFDAPNMYHGLTKGGGHHHGPAVVSGLPRPLPTTALSGDEGGGIGGPFATEVTETEWNHWVKGRPSIGGQPLLGEQQAVKSPTKSRNKEVSPWKKILHVLSAAIPIGLLISAFTPQYLYVDPNSTASLSQPPPPSLNAKYDQHHPHHRPLPLHFSHIHRALGGNGDNGDIIGGGVDGETDPTTVAANFVPTNESLANLFEEVNALFADHSTTTTAASDDESEDNGDIDDIDGHAGNNVHHQPPHDADAAAAAAANDNEDDAMQAHCKFRDICEMSVLGAAPQAHVVHRMLWSLANEKTERNGTTIGANELFGSIRRRNCSKYECSAHK